MLKKAIKWREALLELILLIICVALFVLDIGQATDQDPECSAIKARVLKVDNANIKNYGLINQGEQGLVLQLEQGPFARKIVNTENILTGDPCYDYTYKAQDNIYTAVSTYNNEITKVVPAGPDRLTVQLVLCGIFIALLWLVMGRWGLRAVLSFAFVVLVIQKVMVPLFLKGYNPIPVTLILVILMTGVIMFLMGGINRKGIAAFLGAVAGLAFTCLLVLVFSKAFHVNGAIRPFSRVLQGMFPNINLTKIFLSGIYLTSCGAVMDLAMDIASAMHEVSMKKKNISTKDLFCSGMVVGRSVVGTMTTTLLFAYAGGWMFVIMFFQAQGIGIKLMLNSNYFSAEVLNTLVGSFGLVTVAPFTAFIGALIIGHYNKNTYQAEKY